MGKSSWVVEIVGQGRAVVGLCAHILWQEVDVGSYRLRNHTDFRH